MAKIKLTTSLGQNIKIMKEALPIDSSFDIITHELSLGGTGAYWISINGMYDSTVMQLLLSNLQNPAFLRDFTIKELSDFIRDKMCFGQIQVSDDMEVILRNVVSGPSVIIIDGFAEAIIIDMRKYPARGIDEPVTEKVMRGAKDGFVETMLFNTNMIRRRIRSPQLTFLIKNVGSESKTDVAIAYIKGITDPSLIEAAQNKIDSLQVSSLTLGSKSLEELLIKKRWFNPMPSVQVTERPDVACSYLMEGNILIIVDNSPAVLILPSSIFQFTQSPEDYYKNPLTGNLFRLLRNISVFISLFLLPLFVMIVGHMPNLSAQIKLISDLSIGPIKLLFFIVFAEFGLDLLQYASSHTHSALITPLSIVGGLILSDIAIELNWFSSEVIFYTAITLLSTLMISSYEFADALRLYRMMLVLLSGFFGLWGLIIGTILMLISIITTPTFANKSYFWPLYPFNAKALKTLLFRLPTSSQQPENRWSRKRNKN